MKEHRDSAVGRTPERRLNPADRFHARARNAPARVALLTADGASLSYGELAERAARLAAWLHATDAHAGARVGVLGRGGALTCTGILGVAWAGTGCVPLDPELPDEVLAGILERARLHALVVDTSGLSRLSERVLRAMPENVLFADGARTGERTAASIEERDLAGLAPLERPTPVRAAQLACLAFPPCAAGAPPGVMLTNGNLDGFLSALQTRYRFGERDRVAQDPELPFDLSPLVLLSTWSSGAALVEPPGAARVAAADFLRDERISVWLSPAPGGVARRDRRVLASRPGLLPALRVSVFWGTELPAGDLAPWRLAAPNTLIEHLYGPFEATLAALIEPCSGSLRTTSRRETVALGRPFPRVRAAIVDADGAFLPRGQIGELALTGPQLSSGYWQDMARTARRFPELRAPDGSRRRWFRTGDLAFEDADGSFHFVGRSTGRLADEAARRRTGS